MPGKKAGKKKGKKKKKSKLIGNETPAQVVHRLLKTYERNCLQTDTAVSYSVHTLLRECIDNDNLAAKFVLEAEPMRCVQDPPISLDPLVAAVRQERYAFIKDLHVWDVPLKQENLASLALLLEKGFYPIRQIELMDCLIEPYPITRLSLSFNMCVTLSHVCLDYNEFGDEGCHGLCEGLKDNRTVISLSLNYCGFGVGSGKTLGDMVSTTAVRELYLDGNDLQCEGAMELIKMAADQAEEETYEEEEAKRRQAEEEAEAARREKEKSRYKYYASSGASEAEETQGEGQDNAGSRSASPEGKKKKKKGKKKKKKEPPPPPLVGPWIHKLHLADNGIDTFNGQGPVAPVICLRLFKKLITNSKCLEEIDLEDNLIGDLGAREVMEALQEREEAKLPSIKLRTTHRMDPDTFNTIVKLGAGLKKKKKKKGKKKKVPTATLR